jgi:uncharacterized coiled-coil DUF342 family protein
MSWPELTALVMALVALGGMLIQWRNGRIASKTGDAQAAKDISEAYQSLIDPLEKRIQDLTTEVGLEKAQRLEMQKRIDTLGAELRSAKSMLHEYRAGTDKLVEQMKLHDLKPVWNPPDWIG